MFTARYALSPYTKQTRFVFRGLIFHVRKDDTAHVRALCLQPMCFKFGCQYWGVRFLWGVCFHPSDYMMPHSAIPQWSYLLSWENRIPDICGVYSEERCTRWHSWLSDCATRRRVAGSIRSGVFDHWPHYGPVVDPASVRNEYEGYLLGG
jgi:hypothetical protein